MTSIIERLPQIPALDIRAPSRLRLSMGAEGVLYVGQRVSAGGDFGTIRYVGPVPPTKGDWVGVEWDDPSRGKHNGSKDGVTYFTCVSETGGSFLRHHKISTGISVSQALVQRYASYCCEDGTMPGEDIYFQHPETMQKTIVEAVGMEKVQMAFKDLKKLKTVGLRLENISHAGDEDFLTNRAPNIKDLDLSKNLFHEWESLSKICGQLKFLQQLNMSENIMQVPDDPLLLRSSFTSLNVIVINGCSLTWIDITSCLLMWPQISELHAEKNRISEIMPPNDGSFSQLKVLNLSDNPINHWCNILGLSKLPYLENLILSGCGFGEGDISKDDFVKLVKITLSNNRFETTEIFNQLNNLRNLKELKFRTNPVLQEDTAETMREIIVAKIGSLKMLNRSVIEYVERQGAEIDYLKINGRYWRESGGHQDPEKNNPSDEFKRDHPRYMELVEIHGPLDDAEFFIKSTALKSNLLDVTIVAPDKPEMKPLKKKLPQSMTVGALKMMISRLMKIPIKDQKLEYVSQFKSNHVVLMSKDSESLDCISLETGDTIRVQKRQSHLD